MDRCYDWEKANILQGRNAHVTALLRRPKILTNHQHLNCQTYSNPYSNTTATHHRDGQSQSLRARFKPSFDSCQAEKAFTRWSGTPGESVVDACRTENPAWMWSLRSGLSHPFSRTHRRKKGEDFFRRLCYFVDNVILYSRVAERSSCSFIIWPHSQPKAVEVVWLDLWQRDTPNTAVQTVAAAASAGLGLRWSWSAASFQTPHVKTQTNQWLRRPFSPCTVATSKPKREPRPSRCLS